MEQVEMDFFPRCDDGSLPANSALVKWAQYLTDASDRAYKPLAYNVHTKAMLEGQGFVDISEEVIRVPLNPWPSDPHQREIGRWYNLGLVQGLEGLSIGPLTRMLGWSSADVHGLIAEAKKDICSKKNHVYCYM
jgi:hypothetical protein